MQTVSKYIPKMKKRQVLSAIIFVHSDLAYCTMDYYQLFFAIGAIFLAVYYYYTSVYNYWKNRGIPGPKPSMLTGNIMGPLTSKTCLATAVKKWYDELKNEPFFGIYEGQTPVLVINDLELVRDVFIRDFSVFMDRGTRIFEKIEPLMQNLAFLEPEKWKPLRPKLSPVFTSGKIKEMFPLISECAGNLENLLDKVANSREPVNCHEMAAKFTTDVIGSCAFGINMNAIADENSKFRTMTKKLFDHSLRRIVRESCRRYAPSLFKVIGGYLQTKEINDFFIGLVRDTMNYREENNVFRPDVIYMLMELKKHPEKLENIELTESLLTAQAFVFFVAGFHTSSLTMGHALYELAQHQDIQDKVREEIKNVHKSGGTLNYGDIKEMKYLEKVFNETLRKYPIAPRLMRVAMEDYMFKGTKLTIPKGTKVLIPVYGFHYDSDIYPDPEKFDPERFNEEAVAARHPMSYLPFGSGPRNCIGARFAHYQSMVGLSTILRNHKVDVCEKTMIPYEPDPRSDILIPKGGIHLKLSKAANS